MSKLTLDDLPADVVDKLKKDNGISTRKITITKEEIRTHSISVLNVIKNLTKRQRDRILKHALKQNKV